MFLHFGYFLRKGVFLQKGFLSAEILSFCRNATVFLQKAFGLSVFLQKPTFLQKSTSFCRNQPLSAETNFFLQKGRYFCQLRLSAETFCFLHPLFLFRPTAFRLISNKICDAEINIHIYCYTKPQYCCWLLHCHY